MRAQSLLKSGCSGILHGAVLADPRPARSIGYQDRAESPTKSFPGHLVSFDLTIRRFPELRAVRVLQVLRGGIDLRPCSGWYLAYHSRSKSRRLHKYRRKALRKLGAEQLGGSVIANAVRILVASKPVTKF